MAKIVIINGTAGVGKDTFCKFIKKYYDPLPVKVISSVDYVKFIAKGLGWDGKKDEKGRRFLSDLKLALSRYDDIPYKKVCERVDNFFAIPKNDAGILFIHIREPEEIGRACKDFNALSVLVKNSRVPKIYTNMADANVDNLDYDFIVHNEEGFEHLQHEAERFLDKVLQKMKTSPSHSRLNKEEDK